MKLSELSQELVGRCSKEQTVFFFFPNISGWGYNLLSLRAGASTSTLDNIINLNFSNKIRKNTPSNALIENLLAFRGDNGNLVDRLDTQVFKNYHASVDRVKLDSNGYYTTFKKVLDKISMERLIVGDYMEVIYTYLINKRYDIMLFLISCMIILSPTISNPDNEKFESYHSIIKFFEDFKEYRKYLKTDNFLIEEYIPTKKSIDTLVCTNTQDTVTRSFYTAVLEDTSCKELRIMSINCQSWIANYNMYQKLCTRLSQGLSVKVLIMDRTTPFYKLYLKKDYTFMGNFDELKKYPNFEVKFATIPLTNRVVEDVTHQVMRVDFLVVPNMCSDTLSVFLHRDNPSALTYYDKYSKQFTDIWNNPKYSYYLEEGCNSLDSML